MMANCDNENITFMNVKNDPMRRMTPDAKMGFAYLLNEFLRFECQ